MLWKGKALTTKEDFAEAMLGLTNKKEAGNFRELFIHTFPQRSLDLLGYMLGEMDHNDIPSVQELLDVKHPFVDAPTTVTEMIVHGMSMRERDPELCDLIMQIPRKSWNPWKTVNRPD